MSDQREDEIRAREQVATAGPWWFDENTDHGSPLIFAGADGDRSRPVVSMMTGSKEWGSEDYFIVEERDAQFLAHAREDIPYLLSALEREREARARLEGAAQAALRVNPMDWGTGNEAYDALRALLPEPTEEGTR